MQCSSIVARMAENAMRVRRGVSKQWEDACTRVWYLYKIVRSFDEFVEVMTEYVNSIRQHESLHKRLLEIRRVSAPTEEERRQAEKDLKMMESK